MKGLNHQTMLSGSGGQHQARSMISPALFTTFTRINQLRTLQDRKRIQAGGGVVFDHHTPLHETWCSRAASSRTGHFQTCNHKDSQLSVSARPQKDSSRWRCGPRPSHTTARNMDIGSLRLPCRKRCTSSPGFDRNM